MNVIKLRNGSEEPEPLVATTMLALKSLSDSGLPGMLALYDLAEVCKGKGYEPFGDNLQKLQSLGLLQGNGKPHELIKNIVQSAVQGEGLETRLSSPVAQAPVANQAAVAKKNIIRTRPSGP